MRRWAALGTHFLIGCWLLRASQRSALRLRHCKIDRLRMRFPGPRFGCAERGTVSRCLPAPLLPTAQLPTVGCPGVQVPCHAASRLQSLPDASMCAHQTPLRAGGSCHGASAAGGHACRQRRPEDHPTVARQRTLHRHCRGPAGELLALCCTGLGVSSGVLVLNQQANLCTAQCLHAGHSANQGCRPADCCTSPCTAARFARLAAPCLAASTRAVLPAPTCAAPLNSASTHVCRIRRRSLKTGASSATFSAA